MRKLVTLAATALTLGTLAFAAPAFADGNGPNRYGYNQAAPYQNQNDYNDDRYNGRNDRDHDFDRRDDRRDGNFDRWERGWGPAFGGQTLGFHQPLNYWQITHRLERQGYYGVRGLRPSRFGFGWRAFAFVGRGQPVMLRINPYTGRVLDVRYI